MVINQLGNIHNACGIYSVSGIDYIFSTLGVFHSYHIRGAGTASCNTITWYSTKSDGTECTLKLHSRETYPKFIHSFCGNAVN